MTSLSGLCILFVSFFAAVHGFGISIGLDLRINITGTCPAERRESWSYRGINGPLFWGRTFPNCSARQRQQSPIAIFRSMTTMDENLARLELNNYDQPISQGRIENNGHTIQVTPGDGVSRTISVNGEEYSLSQFHFHWGDSPFKGSEHIVDRILPYSMEMHLVHMSSSGSIAVVGVLFQEDDNENEELQKIIDEFPAVKYKDDSTNITSAINLNNLVPENPASFYRYQGSLTTPPCTEGVTWSVIPQPMSVGRAQMRAFRTGLFSVKEGEAGPNCRLVNNYRPIQPRYDRPIFRSQ